MRTVPGSKTNVTSLAAPADISPMSTSSSPIRVPSSEISPLRDRFWRASSTTSTARAMQARTRNALNGSRNVVLHTDSKYVKDGITAWLDNWKKRGWKTANRKPVKNQDLWQALEEAARRHEITWRWVRGHTGVPGNEEADALANRGIDELG